MTKFPRISSQTPVRSTYAHQRTPRFLPVALLALAALGTSGSVLAQSNYKPSGPVASALTPGATYFSLNAGTADLSRPITAFGLFGGNQQSSSYGIAVGNYAENQNYGVELGYTDFGSVNRYGGSTQVDGINLSLLGRLPLSANFNLLGKVGTTYGRTRVSTDLANNNLAGTEQGFDWSYGLGGELKLTPQWSATLQYDEHFVKYPVTGSERVSATTLGVRYYY